LPPFGPAAGLIAPGGCLPRWRRPSASATGPGSPDSPARRGKA